MSAETLRRAAALMRERAGGAASSTGAGDWFVPVTPDGRFATVRSSGGRVAREMTDDEAEHIASWNPDVALAVADWLTVTAWWLDDEWPDDPDAPMDWTESTGATAERVKAALTVARAYLRVQA